MTTLVSLIGQNAFGSHLFLVHVNDLEAEQKNMYTKHKYKATEQKQKYLFKRK